jgi:hypothetical protein
MTTPAVFLALLLTLPGTARVSPLQSAPPPAPQSITAAGCVGQLPDSPAAPPTGHEQAAAKGLTLTRANVAARDTRGTQAATEQSFWIVGAKAAELLRVLGRRVEVTGTLDERLAANPGRPAITDAGSSASRRAATAPPDPPASAHPSAPTRAISVTTFRAVEGSCP